MCLDESSSISNRVVAQQHPENPPPPPSPRMASIHSYLIGSITWSLVVVVVAAALLCILLAAIISYYSDSCLSLPFIVRSLSISFAQTSNPLRSDYSSDRLSVFLLALCLHLILLFNSFLLRRSVSVFVCLCVSLSLLLSLRCNWPLVWPPCHRHCLSFRCLFPWISCPALSKVHIYQASVRPSLR